MDRWRDIRARARAARAFLGPRYTDAPAQAVLDALLCRWDVALDLVAPDHPLLCGARAAWREEYDLILVDQTLPAPERAFAIAHELGHRACHAGGYACGPADIDEAALPVALPLGEGRVWGYNPRQAREVEANVFAGELLAPAAGLRARFLAGDGYRALAEAYGVTPTCILNALVGAVLGGVADEPAGDAHPGDMALDASQRRAAEAVAPRVLVDAGPGTGKTRTLVARVLHLLRSAAVTGPEILVLTFSNRAAEELRERLRRAAPEAAGVTVSTFHGFALDALRRFAPQAGLQDDFRVVDDVDAALLLEGALPGLGLEQYAHLARPALYLPLYLKLGLSPLDGGTRWGVQPPDRWWGGKDTFSSRLDCLREIDLPPHLSWDQSTIEGRAASTVYKAPTSQERDTRKAHVRMWYAGIDWADQHHDAVVIDEAGQRVATLRVAHTVEGLAELTTFLRGIGDVAEHPEHLACLVETSHGLLISALLEAGLPVYPVNPKTVDRHRKPAGAKTDAIDAYLLARTGRSDLADLRRLAPDSPLITELKVLTRDQDTLIQSQTRLLNQLTACLKAYYPVALDLFGKLHQPTTLAFLQTFPTLEQARAASVEQMAAVLTAAGHPHAAAKAQQIWQQVQQPQLQADPALTRAKARLMLALVAQLQPLIAQIAAYDQEITRLFLMHSDSRAFASLPRAGTRLAPRLLAEWGDDRARYADAPSVQALAGTAPVAFQSGKFATVHRRYACSKPLRNALHQFAWQSTQKEPWARAYYQRKRREGKSHSMAVRALANQWVRIIYAFWVKHEAYDATIFLAAQQAHAPRAA